jgi:hypothetical protein
VAALSVVSTFTHRIHSFPLANGLQLGLHGWAVAAEFGLAFVTFVMLCRLSAPYGRYERAGFGPTLPAAPAWVLMEFPARGEANYRYNMTAPLALPGRYTVHLMAGDEKTTARLDVRLDTRSLATQRDLEIQQETLLDLWNMAVAAVTAVRRIDAVKPQHNDLAKRLGRLDDLPEGLVDSVKAIGARLDSIRAEFVRPDNSNEALPVRLPALNRQMNEAVVPRIISGF